MTMPRTHVPLTIWLNVKLNDIHSNICHGKWHVTGKMSIRCSTAYMTNTCTHNYTHAGTPTQTTHQLLNNNSNKFNDRTIGRYFKTSAF